MMKSFYWFETQYPQDSGFALFSGIHWMWLVGIACFTCITTIWYVRQKERIRKRAVRVVGTMLPLMEIYRDIVLICTGHFEKDFLPFQLCSMALWIAFLYAWMGSQVMGRLYVLLCVPGTLSALLFPNWTRYPFWSYMHIHAFVSHGCILMLGVWLLASGEIHPRWMDFRIPLLFGGTGFLILHRINSRFGTNYWFLNIPSHDSPLVWIANRVGAQWYLVGYFAFCVGVIALWQALLQLILYVSGKIAQK